MINHEYLVRFEHWIRTREQARIHKEEGWPWPWTGDDAINNNHFCNVRREDDRGTKELRAIGETYDVARLPWFYTLARLFNHAPSVQVVQVLGAEVAVPVLKRRMDSGYKVFNTAYVVSTCGKSMDKVDYVMELAEEVGKLFLALPDRPTTLRGCYDALRMVSGMGSFLAGQVVADLKNDRYLADASDWWSWSTIGPGSKKGLDYLFGGGTTPVNYHVRMHNLFCNLSPDIEAMGIHMQDLQNCLCEYSKYIRIIEGSRGRKRIYHHA